MLAKHKVGSSTLLTRSILKPLGNQGLFHRHMAKKAAKRAINGEQLTKATAEKVFGCKMSTSTTAS